MSHIHISKQELLSYADSDYGIYDKNYYDKFYGVYYSEGAAFRKAPDKLTYLTSDLFNSSKFILFIALSPIEMQH